MLAFIVSRSRVVLIGTGFSFFALDVWGHIGGYRTEPYLDVATHVLFGFGLALFFYWRGIRGGLKIFLLVAGAGIFWECVEFTYDHLMAFPYHLLIAQHGASDTLGDLLSNAAGSLLSIVVFQQRVPEEAPMISVSKREV